MLDSAPVRMTDQKINNTADDENRHNSWCFGYDPDLPLLDCLLGENGIDILTIKVENDLQLKQMSMQIFQSLKHVVEDGEHVSTLGAHVKSLLKCPVFINAFLEANKEDCSMIGDVALYSSTAEDEQRLENLKTDSLVGQILQESETTSNIRGILKIIMAYWSDREFYNKLEAEIKEAKQKNAKPKEVVVEVEKRITDLNYPSNVEGLKAAMATVYKGDAYQRICEQIDCKSDEYDRSLNVHNFGRPDRVSLDPPPMMTWLSIVWRNYETFYVRAVGYGLPPTIPVCNDY